MSELYIPNKNLVLDKGTSQAIEDNRIAKTYNEERNKLISSQAPKIELLHNNILVRAVPPSMKETTGSGILINRVEVSEELRSKLELMTVPVDDVQEILAVGNYVEENVKKVSPGKYAKIDYSRFKTLKHGKQQHTTDVFYDIPVVDFDGDLFMIIDVRDIQYVMEKSNTNEKYFKQN